MKFLSINGKHYTTDVIRSFHITDNDGLIVNFKDGSVITIKNGGGFQYDVMTGSNEIVQVILCRLPTWAVWKKETGEFWAERLFYIGLCADGMVRGISLAEGWFEVCETNKEDFLGVHYDYQLSDSHKQI